MSQTVMDLLDLVSRYVFFVIMLFMGLFLLIAGRLKLARYQAKGIAVRIVGVVFLLDAAIFYFFGQRGFLHRYSILLQALVLLAGLIVLWIMAEKPGVNQPLPAGTHAYQSGPDEPAYRLHLRLQEDGSGLLVVNAATVLHLNPTGAEYAYHMMKGIPPDETAAKVAERYRISQAEAQKDYLDFRDRIQTLVHTPDLDPVTFLDFERVAPHSKHLGAPLRLDCALTYRQPEGVDASLAPVKRVERELSTPEWEAILDKAWAAGIPHITFTGGEPTLREDLPALIAHAEKNGQVTGLLSDGIKLADKSYLHSLLQTGLDHLLFILEPENPASWKALETIMPEDLFTTVHLTLTPQNAARGRVYLDGLAKLGVKSLSLSAADASLQDTLQTLRDQAATLGLTLRWDLPVPYSTENPVAHETVEDEVPSGAGKAWMYVEPDGDVLPAQGLAGQILGNLLRDEWEKIQPR